MALTKNLISPSGAIATYHRVIPFLKYGVGNSILFILGYTGESDRNADKKPLIARSVTLTEEQVTAYFSETALKAEGVSPYTQAYAFAKTMADFTDAVDC